MKVVDKVNVYQYFKDTALGALIENLKFLLDKYPDGVMDFGAYYKGPSFILTYNREETSEEKRVRLLREEGIAKSEAKNKEKRRRQYEALKKEFEGELK